MSTKRAVYEIAEYKAASESPGEFTAMVSVFGNVDLQGDRVVPGAFKNSIDRWNVSGDPIPVIWSHDWDDPFAHIGAVTSAVETAKGLRVTGKLDLDKPFAKQVHDLLVARRVTGMSFAYDVIEERPGKDRANELTELDIIEVGPTLKGANPTAQLINAKSLLEAAATKEAGEDVVLEDVVLDDVGEKTEPRFTKAAYSELQAISEDLDVLRGRVVALIGGEPKSETGPEDDLEDEGADDGDTDSDESEDPDNEKAAEGPTVKPPDPTVVELRTRIEEMRATTGIPA